MMASNLIDLAMTLHQWLPKSQIEFEPVRGSATIVTVTLPEYLAMTKGLI